MKFDIKKLYKSTIKTLEEHHMEVSIALAALSLVAFVPESDDETKAHHELKQLYEAQLYMFELQIKILEDLIKES